MNKGTYIEVDKRLDELEQLMLDGYSRADCVRYCADTWNIKSRQTDVYIAKIYDRWKERTEKERKHYYEIAIRRREKLYRDTKGKDNRTALAVLDSADKIKGLFVEKREEDITVRVIKE